VKPLKQMGSKTGIVLSNDRGVKEGRRAHDNNGEFKRGEAPLLKILPPLL